MDTKIFKQQLLDQLYEPYKKCMSCPLATLGRTRVVFGEGNADARLLFIGEAPGRDEDEQGRPFVGRSGKLLTKILINAGISREDVYITNIVKCRPPDNRTPLPQEAGICKRLLLYNQIKIIRPHIICTLGSCALGELLNQPFQITKIRGSTSLNHDGIMVLPTYHPAYVLRNPPAEKAFAEDIFKAISLSR